MSEDRVTILELPEIASRLGELFTAQDQDGLSRYFVDLVVRGARAANVEELANDVLKQMPEDIQAWWNGPCTCRGTPFHE